MWNIPKRGPFWKLRMPTFVGTIRDPEHEALYGIKIPTIVGRTFL